jgi:hypothetical protein
MIPEPHAHPHAYGKCMLACCAPDPFIGALVESNAAVVMLSHDCPLIDIGNGEEGVGTIRSRVFSGRLRSVSPNLAISGCHEDGSLRKNAACNRRLYVPLRISLLSCLDKSCLMLSNYCKKVRKL